MKKKTIQPIPEGFYAARKEEANSETTVETQNNLSPRSLHTPGPWAISIIGGEESPAPEGLTEAQRQRWDAIMAQQRRPFRHNDGSFNIIAGQGDERFPVATAVLRVEKKRGQSHTIEDPEAEANARLIAAAPELLEALKETVAQLRQSPIAWADPILKAEAVIAKVEGRKAPSV